MYLCFLMGPSKESLSILYKPFLRPLLTYASRGLFPFLGVINSTKLERFYRVASRVISGCLSSSPIPLILSESSLPPLRVTLTYFALSSYVRALCLPISFPISGLATLELKTKTLQILLESSYMHSRAHDSFYFSYGDSPCLPSLSPLEPAFLHRGVYPFPSHAPAPIPSHSPKYSSRSP